MLQQYRPQVEQAFEHQMKTAFTLCCLSECGTQRDLSCG